MLSDKEKHAIENIKKEFEKNHILPDIANEDLGILLNLIEKQSKEIEELKEKNKKLQDKAKELIFEKQELTSALLDSIPNDKIKAKIEEIDKAYEDSKNEDGESEYYYPNYTVEVLQSLLEKE